MNYDERMLANRHRILDKIITRFFKSCCEEVCRDYFNEKFDDYFKEACKNPDPDDTQYTQAIRRIEEECVDIIREKIISDHNQYDFISAHMFQNMAYKCFVYKVMCEIIEMDIAECVQEEILMISERKRDEYIELGIINSDLELVKKEEV